MKANFFKYHGLGNDYLVIDPAIWQMPLTDAVICSICDRHFGIGSDGILYGPIFENGQISLRIFNPDGSEAEKSGNGLRIFSRYLYEKKYVGGKKFKIKTMGGVVEAEIKDDQATLIKINMGKVSFFSNDIGMVGDNREIIDEKIEIAGQTYKATCLSIGNPHCVICMDDVSREKAEQLGPFVENHTLFVNRINMQLLKVIDRNNIQIEIWERGAGYTLASGSSSCAAASAAYKLGLADCDINVSMPGGSLQVSIAKDGQIYMTGPVEKVYEGYFVELMG